MAKKKKTRYRAIVGLELPPVRALLDRAVMQWHLELCDARIALVWAVDVEPDQDGRLVLGRAKRASDCDRELAQHDLVVLLNRAAWEELDDAQRLALIDHELCHFVLLSDDDGPRRDDRGRLCFRTRKHDIEEFVEVVKRHGCYLSEVERLVKAAAEAKNQPLFGREAG